MGKFNKLWAALAAGLAVAASVLADGDVSSSDVAAIVAAAVGALAVYGIPNKQP